MTMSNMFSLIYTLNGKARRKNKARRASAYINTSPFGDRTVHRYTEVRRERAYTVYPVLVHLHNDASCHYTEAETFTMRLSLFLHVRLPLIFHDACLSSASWAWRSLLR